MAATTHNDLNSPDTELEHHEYHSAVEIDENVGSWKDWVGPALAVAFVIGAIVLLFLTASGTV